MAQENSAHGAPRRGFAPIRANGCRRVTLEMRAWLDRADSFQGLPPGTAKPLTFLYAFKEAEPYLGLPAHTYKLIDWLVRLTKPQDWEEGSRPIAWPAARRQEEFLGLSERRTQALNRVLQEAGIFVMRDDPQGRRYGYRDPKTGRITKAFGFDLALLIERHEEFKKIAAEAQIERNRMKKLRQQKTLARKAIAQAAEELGTQGYDSEPFQRLLQEAAELVKAGSECGRSDELALAVNGLERRRDEIQQMLRDLVKPVEKTPMGAENDTHSTCTTLTDNDNYHTVTAANDCNRVEARPVLKDLAGC
jgi:replication initiation protein RepC